MALLGVDVSRHQGTIDWPAVASIGTTFAFCKATDGTSYAYTGYYQTNIAQIKAVGLVPGAYHWLQAGQDPVAQARYFLSVIGDPDGLLCALDVEEGSSQEAHAFAAEFKRLTGGHPLFLYTGSWYWDGVLKNPHGADIGPLWHSEYETTDAEIADGPELDHYGGWESATMWQYTSSGSVPGIAGNCDRNIFYGDLGALLTLAGQPTDSQPIKDDDDMFVMYNPNNTFWLVTDSSTVQISSDAYDRFVKAGLKAVAPLAADVNNIITATQWSTRLNGGVPQDGLTQADVEDVVRRVFADAGQA